MSLHKELSGVAKISMALDGDEGYTPKNILITGGAGFIGSHVVSRLVAKYPQYKVCIFFSMCFQLVYVSQCCTSSSIVRRAFGFTNSGLPTRSHPN